MYALQNVRTREFVAFYMHIPKTAGTHLRDYIHHNYVGEWELRQPADFLPMQFANLPIDDYSHLTLEKAHILYPTLQEWIDHFEIDVFTITRNPYERFVSCLRFMPVLMNIDRDTGGQPYYEGRYDSSTFHAIFTNMLFTPQARWIMHEGRQVSRIIRLQDVTDTIVSIVPNLEIDFRQKWWTNEQATEQFELGFNIPKFELDGETKKFVEWMYREDFDLGL